MEGWFGRSGKDIVREDAEVISYESHFSLRTIKELPTLLDDPYCLSKLSVAFICKVRFLDVSPLSTEINFTNEIVLTPFYSSTCTR